jgi:hypothetical protein
MTHEPARPVWLSRQERDAIDKMPYRYSRGIVEAWDAAPTDPVEAIAKWIEWEANIPAVLRALGYQG